MISKQKVYQSVLQEIRAYIDDQDLQPGDKLPAERELAEKLNASRSSVREALRAMELLGLIETRHGEGTYLSVYRPYQTVELLASFILRENKTQRDLQSAKQVLEKEAAKLAFSNITANDRQELCLCVKESTNFKQVHVTFFQYLFQKAENVLLGKVWYLMEKFMDTVDKHYYDPRFYTELIHIYADKHYEEIEMLFRLYDVNRNFPENK